MTLKSTRFILLFLLNTFILLSNTNAQKSKKGYEYSGTKARFSVIGKSTIISEPVKNYPFTIYWNKKKSYIKVEAGDKSKHYQIQLIAQDSLIYGQPTQVGYINGGEKLPDGPEKNKLKCEIRFQLEKISIKIGEAKIEDYLLDGSTVWGE
jgi:hypothetical protein